MGTTITEYDSCRQYRHDGTIDLNILPLKVALLVNTYVPDVANHTVLADVSAHELPAGNGYLAGGTVLSGIVVDRVGLSANDALWAALGNPAPVAFRYAAIYLPGTYNGITDPLIAYVLMDDTPADITVNNTDYYLIWSGGRIMTF